MSSPDRRRLGAFGETAAASFLQRNGYQIIMRSWRCAVGEIDLVARYGDELVFVEVRTRRSTSHGTAEESLTPAKRRRLAELAYCYLEQHQLAADGDWRIDVVVVDVDAAGRIRRLEHLVSAIEQ